MQKRGTIRWMALGLLSSVGWLAGCATQDLDSYAKEQPVLDLRTYFNGPLVAHGIFQDRGGQVVRRFVVQMEGRWDGDQGVLDERFTYSDGRTERRIAPCSAHMCEGQLEGPSRRLLSDYAGGVTAVAVLVRTGGLEYVLQDLRWDPVDDGDGVQTSPKPKQDAAYSAFYVG